MPQIKIKQHDITDCGAACLASRTIHFWSKNPCHTLLGQCSIVCTAGHCYSRNRGGSRKPPTHSFCALSIAAGRVYLQSRRAFCVDRKRLHWFPTGLYFCHRICLETGDFIQRDKKHSSLTARRRAFRRSRACL